MSEWKQVGPDAQKRYTYQELPIGDASIGMPSERRKTGLWRYLRPRFVRRFSPCSEACPAGNDVEGFLAFAQQGRYGEALDTLLGESPLPGVCGRVCFHPCESACNRGAFDEAVSIQGLERFVADGEPTSLPVPGPSRKEKVAIIGSGPAGLTCAYHLRRLGYEVTVFEKQAVLGGMLRLGIPTYRLPRSVLDREIDRILSLGVKVETGCRVGHDIPWEHLLTWDAVFLAAGAHAALSLGIPGDSAQEVISGTAWLEAVNLGRPVSVGSRVGIIGGGNTAVDCARAALRLGSNPVIVYRRTRNEMPAMEAEIEEALQEGIEIQWLTSPIAVRRRNGKLVGLECIRNRLCKPEPGGRARPEPIDGTEFVMEIDTVISAVGETVEEAYLPPGLKGEQEGAVWVDSWGRTSLPGLWAGGDVATDPRMVVHAIGAGKRAALSIHASFTGEDLVELGRRLRTGAKGAFSIDRYLNDDLPGVELVNEVVGPDHLNLHYAEPLERAALPRLDADQRVRDFSEVNLGCDEQRARAEAQRCFRCGECRGCGNCYVFCPDGSVLFDPSAHEFRIDYEYCKGCGVCGNECPTGAIVMTAEGEV
ncbi:MAG: NAD(P)-binding protein [Desulfomonilaceae bacterium]|nr:NAD(P)-binding protein [Desulfomonilaceae bacterium]